MILEDSRKCDYKKADLIGMTLSKWFYKGIMPTYANGYKQAVLKTDEPKGLWVRILPLALNVVVSSL